MEKKFYDKKPKYTLYFRKENGKRWYKGGEVYWTKKAAEEDKKWLTKLQKGKYVYKVMPYKDSWK